MKFHQCRRDLFHMLFSFHESWVHISKYLVCLTGLSVWCFQWHLSSFWEKKEVDGVSNWIPVINCMASSSGQVKSTLHLCLCANLHTWLQLSYWHTCWFCYSHSVLEMVFMIAIDYLEANTRAQTGKTVQDVIQARSESISSAGLVNRDVFKCS